MQTRTVVAIGEELWPWPPKVIDKTFGVLEQKLASYRKEGMPVQQQLAVLDYWISRLFELRAQMGGRYPLYGLSGRDEDDRDEVAAQ